MTQKEMERFFGKALLVRGVLAGILNVLLWRHSCWALRSISIAAVSTICSLTMKMRLLSRKDVRDAVLFAIGYISSIFWLIIKKCRRVWVIFTLFAIF